MSTKALLGIAIALALGPQPAYSQQSSNTVTEAEEVRERVENRGQRGRQERQTAQERLNEAETAAEDELTRAEQQMEREPQSSEELRERAEEKAEEAARMSERAANEDAETAVSGRTDARGRDNAAGRGNEHSQEMRARRDERKSIQSDARGDRETEADVGAMTEADEVDGAREEEKAKKPWWKFWGE